MDVKDYPKTQLLVLGEKQLRLSNINDNYSYERNGR